MSSKSSTGRDRVRCDSGDPPEDGVVLNRVEGPVCSRCFASYKLKVASSRGNVDSRRSVMYLVRDIVERKGRAFYGVKT